MRCEYKKTGTSVYVVLINWCGVEDTIACLRSLAVLDSALLKVIVCDNASTDDSWTKLTAYVESQAALEIQLIQTGANLGFAGGNNVGLRVALADPSMQFVWLLNNDTEVDQGALDALLSYMALNENVGICGSTLLYMDQKDLIQAVGGQFNSWLGTSKHILGHESYSPDLCRAVDPSSLDYVVGASMFVRRQVLEQVGLLEEDYFLYCEEIDWATRMKRKLPELKLGYAPDSLVYHKEGASTGANERQGKTYSYFSDYFFITSRLKFTRKFFPVQRWVVQLSMALVAVNRARRRQWRSMRVALCALVGWVPKGLDPRQSASRPV